MDNARKLNIMQIVYIQEDKDNYKLVRFAGMDSLRAALKTHGVHIGRDVTIGREVLIADGVSIGSGTTVAAEATLESGAQIGNNCLIGKDAFIGKHTRLGNNVTIGDSTEIGRMGIVGDNTVMGMGCIIQDNVNVGFASLLRDKSYIGNESVLGHHTIIGQEARLGRMVNTAPSTSVDSHRVINSFTTIAGSDRNLYQDETLKKHYAAKNWASSIGGEQATVTRKPEPAFDREPEIRKVLGL